LLKIKNLDDHNSLVIFGQAFFILNLESFLKNSRKLEKLEEIREN